jgi:hypothetical protein
MPYSVKAEPQRLSPAQAPARKSNVRKAATTKARKTKAWNQERRDAFLAALAATSNVSASARAATMQDAQAYAERRKSAAFRAAWEVALCEGYTRLELMMLERAMKSLSATGDESDIARSKMEEYSNKLAMTLLTAHRATVRGEKAFAPKLPTAQPKTGVKDRLAAKFDAMHARRKAGPSRDGD